MCSLIVLKSWIVTDLMGTLGTLFGRPFRAHPNSLSYPSPYRRIAVSPFRPVAVSRAAPRYDIARSSCQSTKSRRSANSQVSSIFTNVSRYRSEATMRRRVPSSTVT